MLLLSIDTSASLVSVALSMGKRNVRFLEQEMERGQGEALIPMIQELFKGSDFAMKDLTGVAVAVGPGSFTGVRIGIATARAIAMALNIPVYGVTNFEAYSYSLLKPVTVVLDSKRDDYFVQKFDANGVALGAPKIATAKQLKKALPFVAVGSGANQLAGEIGCKVINKISPTAVSVARIALERLNHPMPAAPLYLREADVTV
ncbi:MAG: tRNA (adenosine(37)-N6)-threonylcarbamoyltransferase complex dimerization subunit type 1 TsaB [Alphaproteobacteria bacterium]